MIILGTDENYLGSTWEAVKEEGDAQITEVIDPVLDAAETQAELLAQARADYDAWRDAQFERLTAVAEKIQKAAEDKEAVCQDPDGKIPPVGTRAFRKRRFSRRQTYTNHTLDSIPDSAKAHMFALLGAEGAVTEEDCVDADCLHPCFGPLHGRSCH